MAEEQEGEAASPSEAAEQERDADRLVMYRTKHIQFLGRSTPIVLQNDNGPCPLLAICNVLLLRNAIQIDPDAYEVSQDRLLYLVANRLLESNSDVKSKNEEYVNNQQQNISDAIDLLPRLATGIDVNVLFRRINDFEFTPECAIFDLLDIGLYHGWIVEPEDKETAAAIGSKSYNTLVGELVSLESSISSNEMSLSEEDTVDFAAAKAATLGIPHPSFSTCRSFENQDVICERVARKGDLEEEAELMKALQMSSNNMSDPVNDSLHDASTSSAFSNEGAHMETSFMVQSDSQIEKAVEEPNHSHCLGPVLSHCQEKESHGFKFDSAYSGVTTENDMQYSGNMSGGYFDQTVREKNRDSSASSEMIGTGGFVEKQILTIPSPGTKESAADNKQNIEMNIAQDNNSISENSFRPAENQLTETVTFPNQLVTTCSGSSGESGEHINDSQEACSSLDDTEPIYEGEECIIESPLACSRELPSPLGQAVYENREPVYEGEAVLADQDASHAHPKKEASEEHHSGTSKITPTEGQLISNFLKDNASQLTICGLFRLQEGLKDRELCVFFRNNHFSTLFKYKDELYLLATDQGYINQPDLVWEKLTEVNGDSVFMTSDFKEFRVDGQVSNDWSQQDSVTASGDYLSTIKTASKESITMNSDLQLAIALQEQEYEQQNQSQQQQNQSQQQQPQNTQTSGGTGRSRLVVGPQMPRSAPQMEKPDSKKEKCIIM